MFGLKLPWQIKFILRGVWLGGLVLLVGAILFATAHPTSVQRMLGLIAMFGALPFAVLVFVVSWLRRRSSLARTARSARRTVPGVGQVSVSRPARRPTAPARAGRASRPAMVGSRR